jgi:DNA-binding response OmpR family regulator
MGRVLIVDDDTDFVELVRRRLTKADHEAVAVTSDLAFQAVVRHQPVIMMTSQDNPHVKARSLSKSAAAPSHRASPGRRIGI